MATFAQSIEIKLGVDTNAAFDALKRVESKMAQVFGAVSGGSSYQAKSIETVQAVTKAVEQQTTKLQQFASKIGGVFSAINFDNVKTKAVSASDAIRGAVLKSITAPKTFSIANVNKDYISAEQAQKKFGTTIGAASLWGRKSSEDVLKKMQKETGASLGDSRSNQANKELIPTYKNVEAIINRIAGKILGINVALKGAALKFATGVNPWEKRVPIPVRTKPGTEENKEALREYEKTALLQRALVSGMTQSDSKVKILSVSFELLKTKIFNATSVLDSMFKKMSSAISLASNLGKIKILDGIEKTEKMAKQHENTLNRIFNAYMKIYSAPVKMAGKMWNFFTTPKAQKQMIDPREQAMQQGMSAVAGMGNLAGATNNINVVINEVRKLEKEAKKTAGAMSNLKNALVFTVKIPLLPFTTLYNAASWTFNKIKSIGIAAFAAIAGVAYKFKGDIETFLNFDREMTMVSTLIDSTKESMEKLKEQTKKIAISTGSDIAETAKGLYWTISGGVNQVLGYTEQNMLNITKQVSELAAATGADATSATRAIMGVVNTYGEKLGPTIEAQAKHVADVLFQTTFLGITSVQELAQEIGLVTPIWAQMNLPIEELGAGLAVLTRGGMNTATATTALKSTITEIMKPSEQASTLAQKLGIDFSIAGLKAKGYAKFMADIMEKTKGMPEHLVVLFNNVRSLTEVLGKAGNQDLFLKYLAEVEKSAGAADKAIGKIQESEAFKEKQLNVRFQVRSEALGAMLTPVWSEIKKNYLNVMDAITLFVKSYWAEMKGDKTASEAFKLQYETALKGLPDFLKVAMSIFQKVIIYAYHFGGASVAFFQKIGNAIVAMFMRLNTSFKLDFIGKAIEKLGNIWTWFLEKISNGVVWVINAIGSVIEYFGKMGSEAQKTQEGVSSWSAIGEFFSMLGGILKEIGMLFLNIGKIVVAIIMKIVEMEKQWGLITNIITVLAVIILAPLYVVGKLIEGTLWLINLWLKYESQLKGITTIFALIAEGLGQIIWAIFNPVDALKAAWETLVGIVKGFYNLLIDLSQLSIKIGSSIYSTISEWTFGSDKKVVETKKKEIDEIEKKNKDAQEKIVSEQDKTNKKIEEAEKKTADRLEEIEKERQKKVDEINKSEVKSSEEKQKKIIDIQKDTSKKIEEAMNRFKNPQGIIGAAAGFPKQPQKTTDTFQQTKDAADKIIQDVKKTSEKTIDIKTTEAERIREIQFQKEQDEFRHLSRMDDILDKDMKRQANIVKKGIEAQEKIIEKVKDRQSDFLKRKGEAEEDFEEKKARIIMSPLSQEGKDIQQRGLANLYQNKLSQALGQNNFQEAHVLAKKVQDIYAGLSEKQDNAMKEADFGKFLDSQNQVMRMFDLENKANNEAVLSAEKKITDLKVELSKLFIEMQKNLSISVSTSAAEDQLLALRKKFVDMRKDFAEYLPGGNEFQYEKNPEIELFGDKKKEEKKDQKDKTNDKLIQGQKTGNDFLLGIYENTKPIGKYQEPIRQKGFSQDNKGQFITNEVR